MANLEKRLEALEATAGGMDEPLVLLVQGFEPGQLEAEIDSLKSLDGVTWKRRAKESEQAFTDRVCAEVRKTEGVTLLVAAMRDMTVPDAVGGD